MLWSNGESLESLIDTIYDLQLEMPAFRAELSAQQDLDEVWLKLRIDPASEYEGLVKEDTHRATFETTEGHLGDAS